MDTADIIFLVEVGAIIIVAAICAIKGGVWDLLRDPAPLSPHPRKQRDQS